MNEELHSFIHVLTQWGSYIFMGLVATLAWVGRRHVLKMEKVAEDYVSQSYHVNSIERIQSQILTCQQSVQQEQRELRERMFHMADRIDTVHEILVKHTQR